MARRIEFGCQGDKMNNVNMNKIMEFVDGVKKDPNNAKKSKRIVGEWNSQEGEPQFFSDVEFANGKIRLESDMAPFLGGNGKAPDPLQYCLYGLASCYANTFVSIATEQNIKVSSLRVVAENKVNLSKALGLNDEPIVEQVKLSLEVKADADNNKLKEIEKLTRERCPGVYCLTNPIKLVTELM